MSYFAAAVVRGPKGWAVSEFDLTGVSDAEDVADRLRDLDLEADISLLFVEIDDEYLVLLRLDEGEDLRVFASDSALAEESRLGAVLIADVEVPDPGLDIPDADEELAEDPADADSETSLADVAAEPDASPLGDTDLLSDLGASSGQLLEMCSREGNLPSDVTTEVCEVLGCADDMEELREA
ncbi:MAG: hypothetical protein GEU94_12510 [Micromonosporaceae bacterium]|nr:hypothetical protein [Micromonosporaceae bacterium]